MTATGYEVPKRRRGERRPDPLAQIRDIGATFIAGMNELKGLPTPHRGPAPKGSATRGGVEAAVVGPDGMPFERRNPYGSVFGAVWCVEGCLKARVGHWCRFRAFVDHCRSRVVALAFAGPRCHKHALTHRCSPGELDRANGAIEDYATMRGMASTLPRTQFISQRPPHSMRSASRGSHRRPSSRHGIGAHEELRLHGPPKSVLRPELVMTHPPQPQLELDASHARRGKTARNSELRLTLKGDVNAGK